MRNVDQALGRLRGRKRDQVLCHVVKAGLRCRSEELHLGALCDQVGAACGKRGDAIYKSLTRAIHDIWEYGDRCELECLMGYHVVEKPSAKEMVTALVQTLRGQEIQLEYRLQEGGLDQKVGVACRAVDLNTGEVEYVVMAPFSRNRETVCQLVEKWNREQMPMEKFREMVLLGKLIQE